MLSFGFQAALALTAAEVSMQLKRSLDESDEVLNIPIILGGVGLGKTAIAREIANRLGLDLVKINCGECGDPTDISGLPVPWRIKDEPGQEPFMEWVLNRAMHQACVTPVVLFFDDIDKAPALVEGALLSVFGERTARNRKLHRETIVMAAGNKVTDDALARRLSESIRTRGTIINLEARLEDFAAYAKAEPGKVHPAVLGFLAYRPALLHKHDPEADRFPTPRSWVEASAYLFEYEEHHDISKDKRRSAWKTSIALKCGEPVSNEFYAWWSICSKIDVHKLLHEGIIEHTLTRAEDQAIVAFAATFALAQELNSKGIKKEHVGLVRYLQDQHIEHRNALLTQLTDQARRKIATTIPAIGNIMYSDIVPLGTTANA